MLVGFAWSIIAVGIALVLVLHNDPAAAAGLTALSFVPRVAALYDRSRNIRS